MPSGLHIINPSGELTVSTEAKMLHYLAKATLVSLQQLTNDSPNQPSSDPAQMTAPGRQAGWSTYQLLVPSGSAFVLAMDLPLGTAYGTRAVGVTSLVKTGVSGTNDVWTIKAYNGDQTDPYTFDGTQYALDIWAFGFVSTLANNYGLALFNRNGDLSADFSRPNPLFPRFISNFRVTKTQAIPALSRPVILGMPSLYTADIYSQDVGALYNYRRDMGFWNRSAATTLNMVTRRLQMHGCNDYPTNDQGSVEADSYAILIEGSGLP